MTAIGHGELAALHEELREHRHRALATYRPALDVSECRMLLALMCEIRHPGPAIRSAIGKILNHMTELER